MNYISTFLMIIQIVPMVVTQMVTTKMRKYCTGLDWTGLDWTEMIDSVPCRIYRIIKAKSSSVRFTVLHSKFLFPQNSFPINLYKSYVKRITCKAVIIPPSLPHLVLILRPQSSKSRGKNPRRN